MISWRPSSKDILLKFSQWNNFYFGHRESEFAQSCPSLCNSLDCSPPGSSLHEILQVRILEWVAMPSSRGSLWPRDETWVSCLLRWWVDSLPTELSRKPSYLYKHRYLFFEILKELECAYVSINWYAALSHLSSHLNFLCFSFFGFKKYIILMSISLCCFENSMKKVCKAFSSMLGT